MRGNRTWYGATFSKPCHWHGETDEIGADQLYRNSTNMVRGNFAKAKMARYNFWTEGLEKLLKA